MNIILFGPPGSGKGTQAANICKSLMIPHLSTGDILRTAVASNSNIGKKVKKIMEDGKLVSDEIVLSIVEERITLKDCSQGFVLDGFPRTINQAEGLEALLKDSQRIEYVLRIKVDEKNIIKRLIERGRDDDKLEVIKNRFKSYNSQTQPLVPFYEAREILHNIDGMQDIEKVYADIKKVIGIN